MTEYRISRQARSDLDEIDTFIRFTKSNPRGAEQVQDYLLAGMARIADANGRIGLVHPRAPQGIRYYRVLAIIYSSIPPASPS